jgi:serine protease Do
MRFQAVSNRLFRCRSMLPSMLLALGCMCPAHGERLPGPQRGSAGHAGAVYLAGYLGIDVRDVSPERVAALKAKEARGAEIVQVDHDGPAGKMGLREHDVIVAMNGVAIESGEQIRRLLREIPPGKQVAMSILRDGALLSVTAQMADRVQIERQAWELHLAAPPVSDLQAPPTGLPSEDSKGGFGQVGQDPPIAVSKYSKGFLGTILLSPAYTGAMLERIGPQLAQFFGVPKGTGLLVTKVETNSPAAAAGVRAGDLVLRMDSKPVASMGDWAKVVRDARGKPIAVVVLREKQEKTLLLTPDARKHS